ncbi:hypothetical protein [Sphingomonas sp. Leaf28]|uniref:hypothetical protein n=1 Tax=Sphingomonas sp. Leaf28 TaxID=1735695 RepID=UPI0012E281E1|nr:hypothetical protein [Sphingomonas sp. Leaf28]
MSAQIIPFPHRKPDADRLALVGENVKTALPIAASDPELDLLLQIGGKLLDNLNDYQAIDVWLARLDAFEANSGG